MLSVAGGVGALSILATSTARDNSIAAGIWCLPWSTRFRKEPEAGWQNAPMLAQQCDAGRGVIEG